MEGKQVTLGSRANAKIALDIVENDYRAPEGWKHIGSGSTRSCWLAPDGVVYKVAHSTYEYDWDNSESEVKAARRWRRSKTLARQDIYVPKCRMWRVGKNRVVAMEYIDGEYTECKPWYNGGKCSCRKFGTPRICFEVMHEMLHDLGLHDMFYANVLWNKKNNTMWIIDLGGEEWQ
jgi:predicted unusual protein kinase regulating ubiquinone biosynthesis (AarF/ABC1/UbiB family)